MECLAVSAGHVPENVLYFATIGLESRLPAEWMCFNASQWRTTILE